MRDIEDDEVVLARQGIQGIQGVRGERGYNGKSAYAAALAGGFRGAEIEFNRAMARMAAYFNKKENE